MGSVRAVLGTKFNTTTGSHTVTATPSAGDLVVIICANTGITTNPTVSDNNSDGLGAYTQIVGALKATSADKAFIYIRNARVGSATSTVFTVTGASSTGGGLCVLALSNIDVTGSTAARSNGKQENQAATGTPAPVLSNTPLSRNIIIGAVFNASNPAGMTPRGTPTYTERADVGFNSPTTGLEVMTINSGETSATIQWGGTSASAFASMAVEIDATRYQTASGTLTTAGALAKQSNKPLSGTLTTAGALTQLRTAFASLSGTLTTAGTLAKQSNKLLSGTLTTAGTIARQAQKALSGTLTTAGAITRQTQKAVSGTLSLSGALSNTKTAILSITATLSTSGSLSSQVTKSLSGTLTTAGALTRQAQKSVTGTLATTGTLTRQAQKALSGSLSTTGNLLNQANKAIDGTLTTTGSLVKSAFKSLDGTLNLSATLDTLKQALGTTYYQAVGGVLGLSGALTNQASKAIGGTLSASATLAKSVATSFSGTLSATGTLARKSYKSLSGSLSATGSLSTSLVAVTVIYKSVVLRLRKWYTQAIARTINIALNYRVTMIGLDERDNAISLSARTRGVTVKGNIVNRLQGRFTQGVDEQIVYQITTTKWGSNPASVVAVVKDATDGLVDVTSTVMPGSPTVSGDVISLPKILSLTQGHIYRVEVSFVSGNNTFEAWLEVTGEL